MPRPSIPEDRINLRLILVSGKTKDYLFRPSDSAGEIAQYVFDNWPIGKFKLTILRKPRLPGGSSKVTSLWGGEGKQKKLPKVMGGGKPT